MSSMNASAASLTQLGQAPLGNLATMTGLVPPNVPVTIETVSSTGFGDALSAVNNVPSMPPIINTTRASSSAGSLGLPPSPSSSSVLSAIPGFQSNPLGSSVADVQSAIGSLSNSSQVSSNLVQSGANAFNSYKSGNIPNSINYTNDVIQQSSSFGNKMLSGSAAGSGTISSGGNLTPQRISLGTPASVTSTMPQSTMTPSTMPPSTMPPSTMPPSTMPQRTSTMPSKISTNNFASGQYESVNGSMAPVYNSSNISNPSAPRIISSSPTRLSGVGSVSTPIAGSSRINVSSAAGPVQNDDVEVSLIRHKYIPQDRIFTRRSDGQVMGRFIKVTTPSGSTALVDVNVEGVMAVAKNDMTTIEIESSQALNIPLEIKTGALNCAGNGVCGVAFECDNGICTMSRGTDMQPQETQFVKVSEVSEEAAVVGGSPFAIPIVRLSEILENPMEVDRKINDSTVRIFEASFMKCQEDLNNLRESLNNLDNEYNALHNNIKAASNNVRLTTGELRNYYYRFNDTNTMCELEIAKHAKVVEELEARDQLYKGLLNLCKIVYNNIDAVDSLAQNFKDINNVVRKDYGNLDRKITEPIIE